MTVASPYVYPKGITDLHRDVLELISYLFNGCFCESKSTLYPPLCLRVLYFLFLYLSCTSCFPPAELDSEHAQKVLDMEHAQQGKLKERQKYFEEAFQQDMDQYLSTGYLQITDRRGPIGSMSSMEVNVDVLEQMDLMDVSDHEALDVFLNSGGEDNSLSSSLTSGPDPESLSSEISLRVPTLAELRNKPSSFSSTEPGSASQDTSQDTSLGECQEGEGSEASGDGDQPLVLPDEEEVQADTALVSLPEVEKFKNSDDSDSQAS